MNDSHDRSFMGSTLDDAESLKLVMNGLLCRLGAMPVDESVGAQVV